MGSPELLGMGREQTTRIENICLQRDSSPHPARLESNFSDLVNWSRWLDKDQSFIVLQYPDKQCMNKNGHMNIHACYILWFESQCNVLYSFIII